ncbi:glycosyltransferase family 4 protein [Bradyrhizobium japonicum]|uniref:glycosyltransferase family 4 protein n=1 Tax=Bradyrhizobium japonicum TaxID=375 RepID=UPI000415E0C0|nr:glycosyltransferase [Bradyrhizobium japonicum]
MTKKRVLIIYRSFFPSLSHLGPATAIRNLLHNMSEDYDFHLVTLNYDFTSGVPMFETQLHRERMGTATVEYIPTGIAGLRVLFDRVREDFDVVDIQCAFDPLVAIPTLILNRLGFLGNKRVFHTPHGIFMDVIMSASALKKRLFCRLADLIDLYRGVIHLAGSPAEVHDIRRNHLRSQNVLMVSQFVEGGALRLTRREKQPARLRMAMVGRVTVQKNVTFALDIVRRLTVASSLDIFGEIDDSAYAKQCIEMVRAGTGQCDVTFKGNLPKDELFAQLADYDVLLHPTLGENFGHSIVEALSLGLPVVISDRSPWTDVAASNAGWALSLSAPNSFVEKLEAIHAMGPEAWSELSEGALRYSGATFDARATSDRYRQAYG